MDASSFPPRRRRRALSRARRLAGSLAGLTLLACGDGRERKPSLPEASFLLVAGDSTFWVDAAPSGVRVRRSPMLLAEIDGGFHELYVSETDRSFYDALIVGQRLYRRDLQSGDSTVLQDDTRFQSIARSYALAHPDEAPLSPDDEVSANPSTHATTETELIDVLGSYLSFEEHVDIDGVDRRDEHTTRRGVIDVRDGRRISVRDLAGEQTADETHAIARRLLAEAVDSVRAARDDRARRALDALDGFVFDSLSFTLVDRDGEPAVEYLVPGTGPRAGGYAFPLAPIPIPAGPWWTRVRQTLPSSARGVLMWRGARYQVLARDDSSGEGASISIRVGAEARETLVARVPLPVRRVHELDPLTADSARRRALSRAFDESALYSGDARTASDPRRRPRAAVLRPVAWAASSPRRALSTGRRGSDRSTRGGRLPRPSGAPGTPAIR